MSQDTEQGTVSSQSYTRCDKQDYFAVSSEVAYHHEENTDPTG